MKELVIKLKVVETPGKVFKYYSCNTQLLTFILERATGKSINEIFDEDGEDTFRKLEKRECEKTAVTTNTVIATGGGIILSDETRKRLQELGEVVYLDVDINTLENRLRDKMDRPLLQTGKSLKNIFNDRVSFYTQTASLSVFKKADT